jgi:adenine-specific DNA-methyltransferase
MMRERLQLIRELLSPGGSVWVHLDDAEMAYCRVLMDEIFGRGNFVASIIWKRRNDPRNTATHVSADHDFILCYTRDIAMSSFNQLPRTDEMDSAYTNPDGDSRGPWRRGDLAARNYYSKGLYAVTTPSGRRISGPPSGSYWRVSEEELNRLDSEGRIFWGPDGGSRPYLKRYLSEVKGGRVPSSVWHPEEVGFVRNGKEEVRALVGDVFATPKPERLLQRVIHIASDPGDIVLDCFSGSGTTLAVAHKMGRRWVGVEMSGSTIETYTQPRLEKVVSGEEPGGITKSTAWTGGGGFRVLTVGPSLYEQADRRLLLADWAKGDEFAQAIAAQLGFIYQPEQPFAGRKGRVRLAVVDGVADEVVVRAIVSHLADNERATVVAKATAPGTAEVLKELSTGSRLLKAPRDLVRQGKVVR